MMQSRLAVSPPPRSRVLIVMPLYHAGGASQGFSAINGGGTVVLRATFDPAECVRLLDEESIAISTFVPAMIQAMLVNVPGVRSRQYPSLERIAYGASAIAESTLREAMQVFGCGFVQAFGMTECTSVLTLLTDEDHVAALAGKAHLLASCGRPVAGTEVRIMRDDGTDATPNERGEILARGPQLMKAYWNMPEATSEALAGGWMHTGDVGYLDDEGYLYVSDRLKDMVVSGGENVYPREVEDVLFAMPGIVDAAVIGVPDPRWGEAVKAVVVTDHAQPMTEQDVVDWCRSRLAGFKCPKSVDFVDELPRNPSGKVLKRTLREPHWRDASRLVG
jgi:acyl-CoA synthetase (AMP-forming)/AMP-acid ligase II